MRLMNRNKRSFWYCQYARFESVRDENGNETGENAEFYEAPVEMTASISGAFGQSQVEQFGNLEDYDKVIVTEDMTCPINENTVLFVDKQPEFSQDGRPLYDYQVRRRAETLNVIAFAISKVVVS